MSVPRIEGSLTNLTERQRNELLTLRYGLNSANILLAEMQERITRMQQQLLYFTCRCEGQVTLDKRSHRPGCDWLKAVR